METLKAIAVVGGFIGYIALGIFGWEWWLVVAGLAFAYACTRE